MQRALKFTGVFLGTALFIFILVFGLNRNTFSTLFENRESLAEGSQWVEKTYSLKGLTEYIAEHPELVSIASFVVDHPDSSITFQADRPRTMGALSNLFVMIAYAAAFEEGALHPDTLLDWNEINRYQLPQIGESAHREAYRTGRSEGYIDSDGTIKLKDALNLLAKSNSPALSDYLLISLGDEKMQELYTRLELQNTSKPAPFSGLWLSLAPSIHGVDAETVLEYWKTEPQSALIEEAYAHSRNFINGENRSTWSQTLQRDRLGVNFMEERNLLELFPKTTALEMAGVLESIWMGELISESVSRQVLDWLTISAEELAVSRNFSRYAAMFDSRVGLLNGIDIGTSAYTGNTTVQALFFDRLHIAVWFHMSSNHMHQDFQQRLIWDPALSEAMRQHNPDSGTE